MKLKRKEIISRKGIISNFEKQYKKRFEKIRVQVDKERTEKQRWKIKNGF